MKSYCARIGLLFGSMLMALAGNLIALGAAIIGSNRAWPVAVANDQAMLKPNSLTVRPTTITINAPSVASMN